MNWIPFMKPKEKKEFDLHNTYIIVEFLTYEEKAMKNKAVKELEKMYQDDLETLVPYSSAFRYSFRFTFNSAEANPNLVNKIKLQQILALIEATSNQQLADFLSQNVEKFQLFYHNGQTLQSEQILPLYNERDVSAYDPTQILEIIYTKKTFLERLKLKSYKFVTDIPKKMMNVCYWIIARILKTMGIDYGKNLFLKFIPIKNIVQWVMSFLMVFFPALAPLLGIGKILL